MNRGDCHMFQPRSRHPGNALIVVLGSVVVVGGLCLLLWWNAADGDISGQEGALVLNCAAGMRRPVEQIVEDYRDEFGFTVETDYDGSGALLSRIAFDRDVRRGDLYLAADASYVETARKKGFVAESIPIARMQPVIALRRDSDKTITSLADLTRDDVKVVLANPELAAIGRIGQKVFAEAGLWDRIEERIARFGAGVSMVGTVSEVANQLKLRTADAGIVWDATVSLYPELKMVRSPAFESVTQLVTIGVISWSKQPTAALRFARYLTARDRGLEVFEKMGWTTVEGDRWAEKPEVVLYSGGVNRPAIEETIENFEKREGVSISAKYGGCGILVSDMLLIHDGESPGNFPDAYFACDSSFIPPVKSLFFESRDVSQTDMVLIVAAGNPKGIRTLRDLARPGLRVGMANEEHSALGALTKKLLEAEGIWEAVKKNVTYQSPSADYLVTRFTVEAKTSVASEDVAVVYRANCSRVGDRAEILPIDHPLASAIQPFVIARHSEHKNLVRRLLDALTTETSRRRFESTGFSWRAATGDP